ncbi:MAG: hypothetical protein K0Q79_175 [Flavipsychrobacter sp.]|jgi:hypothetical protein|nr:hypothetical protein [Flavipsychrobacter sp.]
MKRLFIVIALCIFIAGDSGAQVDVTIHHQPTWQERRTLIVSGLAIGAVGLGTAAYGALDYSYNGNDANAAYRRTDLAIIGAGIGLFAIGGGLVYLGLSKGIDFRWSVVAPKKNEIGLAYNF